MRGIEPAEGRRLAAERTHLAHGHIAETQFANPPSGARFMTPRSRMRELCGMLLIRRVTVSDREEAE